jgi:hypothetical protein
VNGENPCWLLGPAVGAVDDVEQRFVGDAPADVVVVAAAAVVDAEPGGGRRVLHEALEQVHAGILLLEQHVTEPVRDRQHPQGSHGVHEEGVGSVEGVDEPAVRQARPAAGLHGAAHLQRQLVEPPLPVGRLETPFAREPPERAVRADVVEAMIVDAGVRQVRRHAIDRARAPQLEELRIAGGVELQQRRPTWKPFGPLGPPARAVPALTVKTGVPCRRVPARVEEADLPGRQLEQALGRALQVGGGALAIDLDHGRPSCGPKPRHQSLQAEALPHVRGGRRAAYDTGP